MNSALETARRVYAVLAEGRRLFLSGLGGGFPWVLGAELLQLLPFANPPGSILSTDFDLYTQPGYLTRALVFGALQALLYGIAVMRLTGTVSEAWKVSLRATPSVMVAYICYELIVLIGLLFTLAFFAVGMFVIGALGGLVLCLLPLAPTAATSTALALFIFPAVMEKRGPFAALSESSRLARRSWVKVSLVISVPALALLTTSMITDFTSIRQSLSMAQSLLSRAEESGISFEQLDSILAGIKLEPVSRYDFWQLIGTVLGAFAWWYTLAVCYAQYRDLKAKDKA